MNRIDQLHFGGGPTMLSAVQMEDLMLHVRRCFEFAPDRVGEYAIEIDPHSFGRERLAGMRRLGFNRISMKVQVCDAQVRALVNAAREASFRSVSIGLACGAPPLLLAGVIGLGPDRIALDNWSQCGPAFKLLGDAGYVYLGMGDFARPGDDLAIAQKQGRLHCNFQGYSTHADTDQVACGVSAISAVAATYCQNVKKLDAYYDLIDRNELPIERGVRLDMDDVLRRTIIRMLMCQFELSMPCIEQAYPIVFAEYFAPELAKLQRLARDGLVTLDPEWLSVTPAGRVLIRTVCAVFDSSRAEGA
jgi:oxygen-independent coproporphyrinogen-3 oxidase